MLKKMPMWAKTLLLPVIAVVMYRMLEDLIFSGAVGLLVVLLPSFLSLWMVCGYFLTQERRSVWQAVLIAYGPMLIMLLALTALWFYQEPENLYVFRNTILLPWFELGLRHLCVQLGEPCLFPRVSLVRCVHGHKFHLGVVVAFADQLVEQVLKVARVHPTQIGRASCRERV